MTTCRPNCSRCGRRSTGWWRSGRLFAPRRRIAARSTPIAPRSSSRSSSSPARSPATGSRAPPPDAPRRPAAIVAGLKRRLPEVLRIRAFAYLWLALVVMGLANQMVVVAVGWQVYDIHHDPLDLGLIGLAEFAPLLVLALPAGQLADRMPRKLIFAASIVISALVTALLLVVTIAGAEKLWPFLALAAATGVGQALGNPAARALPPELVPPELLAGAMAL